jgi:hypothetical protein
MQTILIITAAIAFICGASVGTVLGAWWATRGE